VEPIAFLFTTLDGGAFCCYFVPWVGDKVSPTRGVNAVEATRISQVHPESIPNLLAILPIA
jgi:hypothetical protein